MLMMLLLLFLIYFSFSKHWTNKMILTIFYNLYKPPDVDECNGEGSGHNCDVNAVCTNTDGSFMCECKDGWSDDGVSCTGEYTAHKIAFV